MRACVLCLLLSGCLRPPVVSLGARLTLDVTERRVARSVVGVLGCRFAFERVDREGLPLPAPSAAIVELGPEDAP
jgi:hypothetical protein